ncbi:MAG: LytR C-terminal domain-containing protein, partial [Bacillota bacterium]
IGGVSYWFPKKQEFSTLLDQYFRNKASLANWDIKIEVLNGNGYPGAATKMKERLTKLGFQVISVDDAANTNFQTTEVINHTANLQKGKAVQASIKGSILRKDIKSETEVDVTVIVGKDYPQ